MNDTDRLEFAALLDRCTRGLLGSYLAVERTEGVDAGACDFALALVSFTSEHVRGTLMLDASHELLARSYAAVLPGAAAENEDLVDWSGELANLLLGQLKRELQGLGVVIQLSTPVVVSGESMRARVSARPVERITCRFRAAGACVRVRLEVAAEPQFAFAPLGPPSAAPPAQGGDAFLFD